MPEENTYFISSDSETELARLIQQNKLLNQHIDLLPQEFIPQPNARILDVACGPGAWSLEVATQFPQVQVVGIDINEQMIAYAQAQAQVQEQQDHVMFLTGNILKPLDFPERTFDFINARLLQGVLLVSQWVPLVKECHRLLKPGGIMRMTELSTIATAGCPHTHHLNELLATAFWRAKKTFSEKEYAVTPMLGYFLEQAEFQVIQKKSDIIDVSASSAIYPFWIQGLYPTLQLIKPFIRTYNPTLTEEELDDLCEASYQEQCAPDFRSHWYFTSVIGEKAQESML